MRQAIVLAILLSPSLAWGQGSEAEKQATVKFLKSLQSEGGGFRGDPKDSKVTLRATLSAARSLMYITKQPVDQAVPNAKGAASFVMECYHPKTGGFGDTPGGPPNVALTAIGIMAGVDLQVPRKKYAKAMEYLKANAKTFTEIRIAAAAVEAWGVKDCPFDLQPWQEAADKFLGPTGIAGQGAGIPRDTGSAVALKLRLGFPENKLINENKLDDVFQAGQWADGGYGKAGAKGSDMESTYRVMRALMMMRERPKNRDGMRRFIAKCRNADGGYGTQPGQPSSAGGVYFAAIVSKWLDAMER